MKPPAKLLIDNPELLIYVEGKLHITVLGGIKLTGLDRLKVTLKLIRTDNKQNAFRHNLDLYTSIQTEQLIEKASEALDISSSETSAVVNNLITALENYRSERLESMKPKQPEKRTLSETERKASITFLKSPNLLSRTKQVIAESGLIGEENNSLIAYLMYTSRKRHTPLHLMCLGVSGTGKTYGRRIFYLEWDSIQDKIFDRNAKYLPDMMFKPEFNLTALKGGGIFVKSDFEDLMECLKETKDKFFVIIQNYDKDNLLHILMCLTKSQELIHL